MRELCISYMEKWLTEFRADSVQLQHPRFKQFGVNMSNFKLRSHMFTQLRQGLHSSSFSWTTEANQVFKKCKMAMDTTASLATPAHWLRNCRSCRNPPANLLSSSILPSLMNKTPRSTKTKVKHARETGLTGCNENRTPAPVVYSRDRAALNRGPQTSTHGTSLTECPKGHSQMPFSDQQNTC